MLAKNKWNFDSNNNLVEPIIIGNIDAEVNIIEYRSLTCSHCAEFASNGFVHLKEKLSVVSFARRKISIDLKLPEAEGVAEAFMSRLSSILGQKGFTVDESQPTYLIRGKIVSRESGFVIENYVYVAEGSLMVTYVNDGSVAGVVPVMARALGNTKNISALKAFSSAGKKAGDDLTDFLLNFEEE